MRTAARIGGIVVIVVALWVAMSAAFGLMPYVWSDLTGETNHLYKYGAWIDLSIWGIWGLLVLVAIWAIRILLRRTRTSSESE